MPRRRAISEMQHHILRATRRRSEVDKAFPKPRHVPRNHMDELIQEMRAMHTADTTNVFKVRILDLEELVADLSARRTGMHKSSVGGPAVVADARAEPDRLLARPLQRAAAVVRLGHERGDEAHGPHGVGAEPDARADLAELRRRFVDRDRHAFVQERYR